MPITTTFFLFTVAIILSYLTGRHHGYEEADERTEYWYQSSRDYMQKWLDLLDRPDDKDALPIPKKEKAPEVVKAMGKAAGSKQ